MSAAGWYPDPLQRHDERWWDGTQWTASVADEHAQFVDLLPLSAQAGTRPGPPRAEADPAAIAAVLAEVGDPSLPAHVLCRRKAGVVDLYPSWSLHDRSGAWFGGVRFVVETPPDRGNNRQNRGFGADGARVLTTERVAGAGRVRLLDGAGTTVAEAQVDAGRHVALADGRRLGIDFHGMGRIDLTDADGALATIEDLGRAGRKVGKATGWAPETVVHHRRPLDATEAFVALAVAVAKHPFIRELVQSS